MAEAAKGQARTSADHMTGSRRLRTTGRAGKASGAATRVADKVKEVFSQ
jgi:uncharacterized protein YjbJ (UPF0337 family)